LRGEIGFDFYDGGSHRYIAPSIPIIARAAKVIRERRVRAKGCCIFEWVACAVSILTHYEKAFKSESSGNKFRSEGLKG